MNINSAGWEQIYELHVIVANYHVQLFNVKAGSKVFGGLCAGHMISY